MIDEAGFAAYLAAFNARDYDAVLDFYAGEPEISFAGIALRGRAAIRNFYAFFHAYVDEQITVDRFAAGPDLLAIEARVRLTARRALTGEAAAEHGFPQLVRLDAGESIEMRQFIHYHLVGGRPVRVICLLNDQG